jgi:formate hydrogenlyase transcriptional activator
MFFLSRFAKRFGKSVDAVSQPSMERLLAYPWPGNIRELQNVIERATVLAEGDMLELGEDLLPVPPGTGGRPGSRAMEGADRPAGGEPAIADPAEGLSTLQEMERRHIVAALRESRGIIEGPRGAARILGLHPNTLRSRMQRLRISRASHETA